VLAATPYIPFGAFLRPAVLLDVPERQEIRFVDGTLANIRDLPLNQANIFVWPRFDNPKLDSEPFRRWQLIRLPAELGGDREDPSALRAYSMICVHLWCLWNYSTDRSRAECPCHGSIYNVQNGLAIEGPASLQAAPNNALAQLRLDIEDNGTVVVTGIDGVVGYGRRVI
jgi:Rieske Fe-S protein